MRTWTLYASHLILLGRVAGDRARHRASGGGDILVALAAASWADLVTGDRADDAAQNRAGQAAGGGADQFDVG